MATSAACDHCNCIDDRWHLFSCRLGEQVSTPLKVHIRTIEGRAMSEIDIAYLQFQGSPTSGHALACLVGHCLLAVQTAKLAKKALCRTKVKSDLMAATDRLRAASFGNIAVLFGQFIANHL
jgi:hypothetical protein